jgi:murein DD-endopeptidase MepM/ murein hydrolase activator NlpD
MWMPSASSSTRIFSIPPVLLYIFVCMLLISWVLLGIVGYMGQHLYQEYLTLREQNTYLVQKKVELDALRHTMERLQKDEKTIRNFLGLDKKQGAGLGQGGEPSPDLSTIAPNDAMASGAVPSATDVSKGSVVQEAQLLQADLRELVAVMRDQRELRDSTPSVVPVEAEDYWFASGFGWRRSPFTGLKEFHNGLDISSGTRDTPIIAPANGVVIKKSYDMYLGKYIQIDHGRDIITTYGHLSSYCVKEGQKVRRGETIGIMGNTGLSTGHHLHYMIKVGERVVNPLHYILNARVDPLLVHSQRAEGSGQ